MSTDDRRQEAFTLIELLAVVAIVGVLMALLLPALQSARESARRTQCASQIKQLALATLNYESARKLLPPSGIAEMRLDPDRNVEVFHPYRGAQLSWIVLLLPYVEQQGLADRFDVSESVLLQSGDPQAVSLPALVCPSDDSTRGLYQHPPMLVGRAPEPFAKGNYAAYTSPFHVDLQMLYRGAFIARGQPLSAIEDGLANTLALAEIRTLARDDDWRGVWAAPWPGASLLAFDMHPLGWGASSGSDDNGRYDASVNAPYVASPGSVGNTQSPNCQGPNKDTLLACREGLPLYQEAEAAGMPCLTPPITVGLTGHMSAAPRSLHPGGVNGAHLDGHVQFLANEIDDYVMAYLVSINDGAGRGATVASE